MRRLFTDTDFIYRQHQAGIAVLGDCLHVLRHMKPESVHLIFADPPYNLGKNFGNGSDNWNDRHEYFDWCRSWIEECFRVLKPNGTVYLMNATQNMPYIDIFVAERYHVLSRIVWAYDSSGVQSKRLYGSLYEPIIMATKTKTDDYTFNGEDIMVEAKTGAQRGLIDYRKTPPRPYNSRKVPGNVWHFPRVRYKMEEYENHPSQKPEALLERIVLASSHPGDVVLDPFAGTFTTCAVALKHGRRAIGIELSETYFGIGLRRMGITDTYNGRALQKDKSRKTNHKSKKDHDADATGMA
ncbi:MULTISPECIES: adenine-specific DNA-methyltransferase [unclassified Paenibacillus]|uniref:adenine-specific DNA-methyltransferase n=1 Tax=unclassified Paenibacillus TaxID=185978 RepID=UPI001C10722F|nr:MULTISPECIES: adenine-specific DNA-methyltransferase [unclassified Paenibacillus]MBU5443320.1 adenine-specific DNA-methyltransferase [Paenibacillus sp. MSJ-34]CAH0118874.1 DNA adenine methyltransferase YhdJ [Paenibacillus sp. CECT 9249]